MGDTPVLIIDDEPGLVEGFKEFLEDEGFAVHQAHEGSEGIRVFKEVCPEIVVTDLRMPEMSGMELIGEIRKISTDTPIIVITGFGSMESAIDAIRLDVFDFLTKPVDLDVLKETLERARDRLCASREIQNEVAALRMQFEMMQSELKERLSKLSEVEPLIQTGRLIAGILHSLNNPLTYIMGQAELLQVFHPEIENLRIIRQQAVRMRHIMSTLMKRMRASQVRHLEWLRLNELLREEVLFLESHPHFKGDIDKEWRLDPELPMFRGIAADFSQVFGNILRNAAEAMKGQAQRKLWLQSCHDADMIRITIADNGPGIATALQQEIFMPFFSTKTEEVGLVGGMGMGIGLYHCQELVSHYRGRIEVQSCAGKGAAFAIHLPRTDGEAGAQVDQTLAERELE